MAFFFQSSTAGRIVALYPSPAGATESLLDLSSWSELVSANAVLEEMLPDVEALLVNRVRNGGESPQYYLVPIDECYRLVGLIRARWSGLSGGTEMWREIDRFFEELTRRAEPAPEAMHA